MAIVIESPKLLSIRITKLTPKSTKNNFVYTFDATLDVTAQLHSGTTGFNAGQFDGRDIQVGDYVATTGQGRVLKISEIKNVGPTRVECVLIDEDQVNAAIDSTQFGESSIDADDGILFELREGRPYLFPLPDILPGGLTEEFAIQIATRFNFVNKEKNINVEQTPHNFVVGETIALGTSGWTTDTTDPTGVVVKTDDDSFSVRLFGTKTHMELPGSVGDIYFWDPVDRILTTTPNSSNSLKLFQKLSGKEALLLDTLGNSNNSGSGSSFSGNYNDLVNKPIIPSDVSQLTDASGLLQHITKTSELTNDSNFVTQTYVDQQIANVGSGGSIDLSAYATTNDLNNSVATALSSSTAYTDQQIATIQTFSGDYNDLTNKPTIPDITELATTAYVDQQISSVGSSFSGDYNDLINTPVIPDVTGFATSAYVDLQIAAVQAGAFSGDYNDLSNKPVLFTGNYNELYNTPAIPTKTSDLIHDSGFLTSINSGQITAALGYTPQNAATAFNGDYNSLVNKPTIPSTDGLASVSYVDQQIANVTGGGSIDLSSYVTETELAAELANYQPTVDLSNYYTKTQVDALIPTVFSGSYTDLTDTPTIPDITGLATTTYVDQQIANVSTGNVDLTGYATQTYVQQQISSAQLGGIANISDLNDVAIDGTETTNHVLMYNAINQLWENVDLDETFATRDYVTQQIVSLSSSGTINLSGYATQSYVEQKLLERGEHFSGNYNDLVNRPILFSGDYRDLINAPADNSDLRLALNGQELQLLNIEPEPDTVISSINLEDLGGAIAQNISYNSLKDLPDIFSGDYNDLVNRPVLFSGNYADLANKPYIPSIAGLATEQYVNDKHAEPIIIGDKAFTGDVIFNQTTTVKTSTVNTTAEHRNMVMALQTTNENETEVVFNDGSRITVDPNSTAMFEIHIVGATATDHFGVKIKGIVNNSVGTVTLIGTPSREILAQTDSSWAASVTADDVTDSLKITVTGASGITIDWTVFCEINVVKR